MSRQKDRDEFIAIMTQEGVPLDVIRALMRAGTTLHRIAELQCSSEAADRDQVWCPSRKDDAATSCLCRDYGNYDDGNGTIVGILRHGTVPRINVQEAQIEARVQKLCAKHGLKPVFNGDPRGAVLKIKVPSGRTNDWGRDGICVP